MTMPVSPLQKARAAYQPKLPAVFLDGAAARAVDGAATEPVRDQLELHQYFDRTYGLPMVSFAPGQGARQPAINVAVILSGGQAPGGHNVMSGLFDGLKSLNPENRLFGFLGGPIGLIKNKYRELTADVIDAYRNTGGFDIIGSGRDKLEKVEQFEAVVDNCRGNGITAVVVIGGDDSNTNACMLAEYCAKNDTGIQVIGCPKTIDGDLKNAQIEISFGHHTACKVYSELIGNIERDSLSAKKYWHFVKLMGRSASHIALECALQTHPNVCIISEEVEAKNMTLREVIGQIVEVIVKRADQGMNFGVVLVPEGLIEFIPAMKTLIKELNDLMATGKASAGQLIRQDDIDDLVNLGLTVQSAAAYHSLPNDLREQLVMDRDPHGNVQVSLIQTENLLAHMCRIRLLELAAENVYKGKFKSQTHFLGYEGRCAAPSNFDADYCYSLGYTAAALIGAGKTGYLSSVRNLAKPAAEWTAGGVPITSMMNLERRHGIDKPVIEKALVDLDGKPFGEFAANREAWALGNEFVFPGPIQYFGPTEVCDPTTITLQLESE